MTSVSHSLVAKRTKVYSHAVPAPEVSHVAESLCFEREKGTKIEMGLDQKPEVGAFEKWESDVHYGRYQ